MREKRGVCFDGRLRASEVLRSRKLLRKGMGWVWERGRLVWVGSAKEEKGSIRKVSLRNDAFERKKHARESRRKRDEPPATRRISPTKRYSPTAILSPPHPPTPLPQANKSTLQSHLSASLYLQHRPSQLQRPSSPSLPLPSKDTSLLLR